MPLPIFTIQTFNQNTLQPAGAVFAQRVEAVSIVRDFLAGITGIVGGRNTAMEKKMNDLTSVLMEELQLQARTAYPNAIALVDVKVHFCNIGNDGSNMFLSGQASATALIKRNKVNTPAMAMAMATPVPAPVAAPVASPVAAPVASPVAAPVAAPVPPPVAPNNSKVGGRKSFISKSRKNRI